MNYDRCFFCDTKAEDFVVIYGQLVPTCTACVPKTFEARVMIQREYERKNNDH